MLGVESAEACGLISFCAAGELACSCAAGACSLAAGVTGDAFALAADDAAASVVGGDDGLAVGADAATGEAAATGALVVPGGDTGPVAGGRELSLLDEWLTAGAPAAGSGRASRALSDGAVGGSGAALLVAAVSELAVLRSGFSIPSGAVSAILGAFDVGASASLTCGGAGGISATGVFDPAAGEEVACGSTLARADVAAGASAFDCPTSTACCFVAGDWT